MKVVYICKHSQVNNSVLNLSLSRHGYDQKLNLIVSYKNYKFVIFVICYCFKIPIKSALISNESELIILAYPTLLKLQLENTLVMHVPGGHEKKESINLNVVFGLLKSHIEIKMNLGLLLFS